mgnify:CR=1 FL=1
MSVVSADIEPLTFIFEDDGLVPNNPLPFLVYRGAVNIADDHTEKTIEGLFGAHGWGAMWRNGVYDFPHYHATVHEVLGIFSRTGDFLGMVVNWEEISQPLLRPRRRPKTGMSRASTTGAHRNLTV